MRCAYFAVFLIFMLALPGVARAAENLCGSAVRPVVMVKIEASPVVFDTSQTKEALAQMRIDTASPWPSSYHTVVGGVMTGMIAADHKIKFSRAVNKSSGRGCLWFDEIEITLRLDPKIYIAQELRMKGCAFHDVFVHESKHVEEDISLMNKYQKLMEGGLRLALMERKDYSSGTIPAVVLDDIRKRMEDGVLQALHVMFAQMMRERAQRQQAIDSLGGYIQVSGGC